MRQIGEIWKDPLEKTWQLQFPRMHALGKTNLEEKAVLSLLLVWMDGLMPANLAFRFENGARGNLEGKGLPSLLLAGCQAIHPSQPFDGEQLPSANLAFRSVTR